VKANDQGQVTKAEAGYTEKSSAPKEHRCGICTEVRKCPETGKHFCRKVQGEVTDLAGCKQFFNLNLIKWANDYGPKEKK
jgi:hypothetical protein